MTNNLPQQVREPRKPFQIRMNHKRDFRDWVKDQFPNLKTVHRDLVAYKELEERIYEVHANAISVLTIISSVSSRDLIEYYRLPATELARCFNTNLMRRPERRGWYEYADFLSLFVDSIGTE